MDGGDRQRESETTNSVFDFTGKHKLLERDSEMQRLALDQDPFVDTTVIQAFKYIAPRVSWVKRALGWFGSNTRRRNLA